MSEPQPLAEDANPSLAVTVEAARADLKRMARDPRPLRRPLVILDGYLSPPVGSRYLRRQLAQVTGDERILSLSFGLRYRFRACRTRTVRAVLERFGGGDAAMTGEVDVVGISMGGLIGRFAAVPGEPGSYEPDQRLRIARLFTLGTPHRGAALAPLPAVTELQVDMRAGSPFLRELDRAWERVDYELYPYVRLRDRIVGPANAAPHGQNPWWVPNMPGQPAHMLIFVDPRIVADIARRLRGEEPLATEPRAALPAG